MYKYFR